MIMKYKEKITYTVFILLLGAFFAITQASSVRAQTEPVNPQILKSTNFSIENIPSLFFTYWQHKAILEAQKSRGVVRPPTQAELEAIDRGDEFEPDAGVRSITLGGIVYAEENNWVIWLNGQRVTPNAVPKEVLDLRVFEDYIEIKWLDDFTNQIFPLRLRAHQRFNLDARIFLPG
ncbi:MAG: hypothetical protein COA45_00700 [Zetaproteobacteria bacterium]|nr:MAG: hypothetical protein COA45_00700 [Zetaproteobacteria bacterium]